MSQKTELGTVQIRREVIGHIAQSAACEVPGVIGIWKGFLPFLSWCGIPAVGTAIREQEVRVRIALIVEYGVNIPTVAVQVQDRVREMVERMTQLTVTEVNVRVQRVQSKQG